MSQERMPSINSINPPKARKKYHARNWAMAHALMGALSDPTSRRGSAYRAIERWVDRRNFI